LARQLAEVLLRGVCEKKYIPMDVEKSVKKKKFRKYSGERFEFNYYINV
jgi:hypothetical protein